MDVRLFNTYPRFAGEGGAQLRQIGAVAPIWPGMGVPRGQTWCVLQAPPIRPLGTLPRKRGKV